MAEDSERLTSDLTMPCAKVRARGGLRVRLGDSAPSSAVLQLCTGGCDLKEGGATSLTLAQCDHLLKLYYKLNAKEGASVFSFLFIREKVVVLQCQGPQFISLSLSQ